MKKESNIMVKVLIFVHCKGYKNGGYKNTVYFETKSQMREWLAKRPNVEALNIEVVTLDEFAEDYIMF